MLTTIDPRLRLRLEKRALGYSLEGFVGQVGVRFGVATRWVELAGSFVKSIEPFGSLAPPSWSVSAQSLSGCMTTGNEAIEYQ